MKNAGWEAFGSYPTVSKFKDYLGKFFSDKKKAG